MSKRILHIVGDSQFGGGAVLILQIAQAAAQDGNDVAILSTNRQFQTAAREAGIKVVDLDCIWREIRPAHDLIGLRRLTRYLNTHRFDIVHTHTSKAGFVGRAAGYLSRTPVVLHTVHGFAFHEESSPFTVRIYSWLERRAAKWCDKIVTVSLYHRTWALNLGICDPDHIVAIPNGISPCRATPSCDRVAFRAELGLDPGHVVLVSAGRLAPQKGIEYLIDAVASLVAEGMDQLRVILAGEGPMRAVLEAKIKENRLDKHFMFLGFRTDVADLLHVADIAVMPTEREGLSISLLEAMAAGKPVITTTIGSNLEVTENGKFATLVHPKDAVGLAQAIAAIVVKPDQWQRMGQRAREHFLAVYSEQKMLSSYLALYDELSLSPVTNSSKHHL